MKRWRLLFTLVALLMILAAAGIVISPYVNLSGAARIRPADEVERVNGLEFRHYFTQAGGVTWHHVEYGAGDRVIVFLHGIPGAWYSWHHVMERLGDTYRTIAIDLKGLGLTSAGDTSYSAENVAAELTALMDALGVRSFALVAHEWGSVVASYVAGRHWQRVSHFVRLQAPISDAALSQIRTLLSVPQIGATVLGDANGFVRRMYTGEVTSFLMANVPGNVAEQPVAEEDIARIVREFSYEGIPQAIIRYYQDTPSDLRQALADLAGTTIMPTLLVQGDSDPIQPLSFYEGSADRFPMARLHVMENTGHVPMLEQPAALAALIRNFVS
jgi:pimeloyl-ACP methyl ester carboxylesterase